MAAIRNFEVITDKKDKGLPKQTVKTQRGSRGLALLFPTLGAR